MKKIELRKNAYLLFEQSRISNQSILIVPNSAGKFARSRNYGEASPRIDKFCIDLAEKVGHNVFCLVLAGQDKQSYPEAKYSYTGSVLSTIEAIGRIRENEHRELAGVMGMCTGGAIAAEAMYLSGMSSMPLVLYNTAGSVGWTDPEIQKVFLRKYGEFVNLDCAELTKNAPASLIPVIEQHTGRILQIATGKSDYKIERQREIRDAIPRIHREEFLTMSDAPMAESPEYEPMLEELRKFFLGLNFFEM